MDSCGHLITVNNNFYTINYVKRDSCWYILSMSLERIECSFNSFTLPRCTPAVEMWNSYETNRLLYPRAEGPSRAVVSLRVPTYLDSIWFIVEMWESLENYLPNLSPQKHRTKLHFVLSRWFIRDTAFQFTCWLIHNYLCMSFIYRLNLHYLPVGSTIYL